MSKGNRKRRRALGLLPEPAKCSARTSKGNPCQRPPIVGGNVCWHHGGAAGQTRRKAQERLLKEVPAMLLRLRELASDDTVPPAVRLAAIRDWLDRAGIDRTIQVEVTVGNWQDVMVSGIVSEVDDDRITGVGGGDYSAHRELGWVVEAEIVEDGDSPP